MIQWLIAILIAWHYDRPRPSPPSMALGSPWGELVWVATGAVVGTLWILERQP